MSNSVSFLVRQTIKALANFFYFFSCIIPKQKNLYLYSSWFGKSFSDNPKYLFLHAARQKNNKIYWITKSKVLYKELLSKEIQVVYAASPRGAWLQMRANAIVFSHSHCSEFYPFFIGRKTKRIQAWHGAPLKKIADDDSYSRRNDVRHRVSKILFPYLTERFDLIFAMGDPDRVIFARAFATSLNNVRVTGYPRNDALRISKSISSAPPRNLLYMPTFRGTPGSDFELLEMPHFDIKVVDDFLSKHQCSLDIKLHPVQSISAKTKLSIANSRNIKLISNNEDIYSLTSNYEGLITDYSSIFFDALLTGIKIYMLPIDRDFYLANDRELYYDYEDVCPSRPASSWNELLEYIFTEIYPVERYAALRSRFHRFTDTNSTERAYNEIEDLMKMAF